MKNLEEVLRPLITIADRLDDEARKFWGQNDENKNERDPKDIILYTGRGGVHPAGLFGRS